MDGSCKWNEAPASVNMQLVTGIMHMARRQGSRTAAGSDRRTQCVLCVVRCNIHG